MMIKKYSLEGFMENILSSLIVAIFTSILTVLGTLYVQKRKNKSTIRKNALYLYLNMRQAKADIDQDKKAIDNNVESEISSMGYFNSFDYIGVLCELKDKLNEQEIIDINNFYEKIKRLESKKIYYFNMRTLNNNNPSMNPALPGIYFQQYMESYAILQNEINLLTNSNEYKMNIVEIISKLKKMKNK